MIQADKVRCFLEFKHLSQNVMQMFIQLRVSNAVFVVVIVQNLSAYLAVRLGAWTSISVRYVMTLVQATSSLEGLENCLNTQLNDLTHALQDSCVTTTAQVLSVCP